MDKYYEVVSINKSVSNKIYFSKVILKLFSICFLFMIFKCFFDIFVILSQLCLLNFLFKSYLFISSTFLGSGIAILSIKTVF